MEPWLKADVGSSLVSVHPLSNGRYSIIAFYRRLGGDSFTKQQRNLIHLIFSELDWLHREGWPDDVVSEIPKLSSKQRIVLSHLLEGMERKEIANRMNISIHSVGDYLKALYRFFGVNSHAQLLRKFRGK